MIRGFLFSFLVTLAACDCQYHLIGEVRDASTQQVLSNVTIGKMDVTDSDSTFHEKASTDKNGLFEVYGVGGQCITVPVYIAKEGYKTKHIVLRNRSKRVILLEPVIKNQAALFDRNKTFEITKIQKSNDYPSSEKDTSFCADWMLSAAEAKRIISACQPISGSEWHHLFDHLPCQFKGTIVQNTAEYSYSINGGSWLTISSSDTTWTFGNYQKEYEHYFLSAPWTETEMEE